MLVIISVSSSDLKHFSVIILVRAVAPHREEGAGRQAGRQGRNQEPNSCSLSTSHLERVQIYILNAKFHIGLCDSDTTCKQNHGTRDMCT